MIDSSSFLLAATVLSWLAAATNNEEQCEMQFDGTCVITPRQLECGIYMGPSTLGEASNMGMYAGFAYSENETIQEEIAIPLLFREWGQHRPGFSDGEIWDRYIWDGWIMDTETYTQTDVEDTRAVFVPGIGCTINGYIDMNNLESTSGSTYDTAGLHRSKDPGSGAFCPYHSSVTKASTDIAQGSELFAAYGGEWIPSLPGAQVTNDFTMDLAEDFLREDYWPWIKEHNDDLTDELKEALWDLTVHDFPVYGQPFTVLPRDFEWSEVEEACKEHENDDPEELSIVRKFIRKQRVRSMEWLQDRAYCVDHIRMGLSEIDQAGRGAFANRDLPAGTIVGYSALIHVALDGRKLYWWEYPDEDEIMGNYDDDDDDMDEEVDKADDKVKVQYDLIINYSFGHRNSSIMLTPYGGMVNYINHASGDLQPNVKVRWPNKELIAHKPEWLNKTPQELRYMLDKIGLSFEYVALRDIAQGEEILMDYGEEWEQAWKEHVANWKPVEGAEHYKHSSELKDEPLRTEAERETNPYPENLLTMCIESYTASTGDGDDGDGGYKWIVPTTETTERVYCDVLDRTDDDPPLYTVELQLKTESDNDDDDDDDTDDDASGSSKYQPFTVVVKNVPKDEGVFLYDRVYSNDWHLPNVFRHEIMIPDEVMPDAWQNGPPEQPK